MVIDTSTLRFCYSDRIHDQDHKVDTLKGKSPVGD